MTRPYILYRHILRKEVSGYKYDKYYYGITSTTLEARWQKGNGYRRQAIYKDIKNFGWDNFEHEVLFDNLTLKEAELLEQLYIALYNTQNENYGWNDDSGGINGLKSDRCKNKLSKNKLGEKNPMYGRKGEEHPSYGKHHSEETKKKISETQKGRPSNRLGSKHNEESKKKMSESHKGQNGTKVINLDTGEVFDTMIEAGEKYNIKYQGISRVCRGLRKTCGGYHWAYYKE